MIAQRYRGYLIEVDEDSAGWWWHIYDEHGDPPDDPDDDCLEPLADQYAAIEDAQIVIDELTEGSTT